MEEDFDEPDEKLRELDDELLLPDEKLLRDELLKLLRLPEENPPPPLPILEPEKVSPTNNNPNSHRFILFLPTDGCYTRYS